MYSGSEQLLRNAWVTLGQHRTVTDVKETSATVSTNRVYQLTLDDGHQVIAKVSSYGSYVHFRQDHALINEWIRLLRRTRYRSLLAGVLTKDDKVFTYREGNCWAVFYEKVPFYDFLPPRLTDPLVISLGKEMARLHLASAKAAQELPATWKSVGSDIATLFDFLGSKAWRAEREFPDEYEGVLRDQCEQFLNNAASLGYHTMQRMPVLIDWNIGNFSVGFDGGGFKLFSRWDYDWFRIEPRVLDFYFCARVARDEGDQSVFSYLTTPLTEPRFLAFLRAYHQVYPLEANDILMLKEAYRFFILNYVIRSGEHFFRPSICRRLFREATDTYLPSLDQLDLRPLVDKLLG
jgi:Ser/Thr protein kinase RdoA (MazF antagonist)